MGISLTNYQRPLQCWDNANFPGTSSSYNKSINQRDYSITNMLAFKLAERDRRHTTIGAGRGCLLGPGEALSLRSYQQPGPGAARSAPEVAGWPAPRARGTHALLSRYYWPTSVT